MTQSQPKSRAGSAGVSLAEIAAGFEEPPAPRGLPLASWIKIAAIAGLFVLVNFWQFQILIPQWRHDADWSHGFMIPLFSLYLLYSRRRELLSAPRRACLPGLAIMLLGLLCAALGVTPVHNHFFSHVAMVLTLFGLVLYLAGPAVMKVAWLPVVYLVLAMPIPGTLYGRIALPLQMLAAKASGAMLHLFGVKIQVTSLRMDIVSMSGVAYPPLTVAEACSGVRSMMAFVALSVAWAYITDRPAWQRLVLILAGIPVMVACNILRVALTCTMYVFDQPEFGQDLMHEFMGMVLLIPAAGLLYLLSKLMQSLYVEEDEDQPPADQPVQEGAKA
ncbi:MAG TPA: exosortase/archaeosortase family protein [Phycisphaerae bacterium]|nr:exosortase/archaeosortase family protein [Phycisphaerae bacterium]